MRVRARIAKAEQEVAKTPNRLTGIVVEEVSVVDRAANQRKFLVVKHDAPASEAPVTELETAEKATWSAAEMDKLPDSSFLYVESGGEKDDEGKTKPRSLRHFPVKDADGKVDLPHLRNALARIPQSDLPEAVKTKLSGE